MTQWWLRTYVAPTPQILQWVARQIHGRARVVAVEPLAGGITADMDRLSVASPAGVVEVILRRWSAEAWAERLVMREASVLRAVRGSGVPAPELLAVDEHGTETGVPCTLTSVLPGRPDLTPADLPSWLAQLASTQAAIHAVPQRPSTRLNRLCRDDAQLDWLTDRGLRAAALAAAAEPLADELVLVHGDYQHFNVLWSDGRLSGVVDWPNAATGNRGTDVGHCRLNLTVLFDARTAAHYLELYERAAGVRTDRRADLHALLQFNLDWRLFIPRQVAGRAPLDVAGMPDRVAAAIRDALNGLD